MKIWSLLMLHGLPKRSLAPTLLSSCNCRAHLGIYMHAPQIHGLFQVLLLHTHTPLGPVGVGTVCMCYGIGGSYLEKTDSPLSRISPIHDSNLTGVAITQVLLRQSYY